MRLRFAKSFDKETGAKKGSIHEMGISDPYEKERLKLKLGYETSHGSVGSHKGSSPIAQPARDIQDWIHSSNKERINIRHKSYPVIKVSVKPKKDRWLATIEINPKIESFDQECNQIKSSLENNGWKLLPKKRGTRSKNL